MAWSFQQEDVKNLLNEKVVVVVGDSIMRAMYKDIVCLLTEGRSLRPNELKAKGELEFLGDKLLEGGKLGKLNNGINYKEVRRIDTGHTVVRFYFVTRCFSNYVQTILDELKKFLPDIIIMNSCIWDLHRYGPHGLAAFKQNLQKLVVAVKESMGPDTLFIWTESLPVAKKCKGGFLLPYFDTIPSREVVEANYYAHDLISKHNHIFLDLHTIFSVQLHHRCADGIHWNNIAHRRISNLLVGQISKSWKLQLTRHFPSWQPALMGNLCMYPGSTKLACSHSGHIGFTAPLQTDVLHSEQYGGIGRSPSSFDLASGVSVANGSSSSETTVEKAYKNRFGRFAFVNGPNEIGKDKTTADNVTTAYSDASKDLVLPTSAPTNEVKPELVETLGMNQCKDSAQVIATCKTDVEAENSKCGPSTENVKEGNGRKRKMEDETDPLEKPGGTTEVNENQMKKLKYDVPTIQPAGQICPLKPLRNHADDIPKVPVLPTGQAYCINQLLKPRNLADAGPKVPPLHTGQAYPKVAALPTGQAYCINQLLKPRNLAHAGPEVPPLHTGQAYPKVAALPTGQAYCINQLLKPGKLADAGPKVPMLNKGQADPKLRVPVLHTGQAYCPNHLLKQSHLALANSRFHPYSWYHHPHWPGAVPLTSLPQKPRNLVYRPTAPGYSSRLPSWRSRGTSDTRYPYQEVLRLVERQVSSRYH